ncbi:MAG: hypothetical protein L7S48_07380 [Candidatus Poseidonia sp.]|nr:hypothetical protein [Poseidonia sp.]
MSEGSETNKLSTLLLTSLLIPGVLLGLTYGLHPDIGEGTLIRFANSMLTSFTMISFLLLLTLFVYGDARKRPVAPFIGMLLCGLFGVAMSIFFLSQGDLLMEENGSVRAQALTNIIRFSTTVIACAIAAMLVLGMLFASLMHTPPARLEFEEE